MKAISIFAILGALALVFADKPDKAKQSNDCPKDVMYRAIFYGIRQLVLGVVSFWSDTGFASGGVYFVGSPFRGPYSYYISTDPVPADKICSDTGGMFDPYGGNPDETDWQYIPIGDLSAKHGKMNTPYYRTVFDDPYLSLNKNNTEKEYIGGRAIVVVDANKKFIACANLKEGGRSGETATFGGRQVPIEFAELIPKENETHVDVDKPLSAGKRSVLV